MKVKVYVTLKSGVLDPQGKAIAHSIESLGYSGVQDVRVGKYFELEVEEGPDLKNKIEAIADRLLANTVIENFKVEF